MNLHQRVCSPLWICNVWYAFEHRRFFPEHPVEQIFCWDSKGKKNSKGSIKIFRKYEFVSSTPAKRKSFSLLRDIDSFHVVTTNVNLTLDLSPPQPTLFSSSKNPQNPHLLKSFESYWYFKKLWIHTWFASLFKNHRYKPRKKIISFAFNGYQNRGAGGRIFFCPNFSKSFSI